MGEMPGGPRREQVPAVWDWLPSCTNMKSARRGRSKKEEEEQEVEGGRGRKRERRKKRRKIEKEKREEEKKEKEKKKEEERRKRRRWGGEEQGKEEQEKEEAEAEEEKEEEAGRSCGGCLPPQTACGSQDVGVSFTHHRSYPGEEAPGPRSSVMFGVMALRWTEREKNLVPPAYLLTL